MSKCEKYGFSVIIPAWNVEKYIADALDSVLSQSFDTGRIQIVVVDDGSEDKTGDIAEKYRVKHPGNIIVVHQQHRGVASARNAALVCVSGEYVCFLDADDKFEKNLFTQVWNFFSSNRWATDVVYVPTRFFDAETGAAADNGLFPKGCRIVNLIREPHLAFRYVHSAFIKRTVACNYRFDERLIVGEDIKFLYEVLSAGNRIALRNRGCYLQRRRRDFFRRHTCGAGKNARMVYPSSRVFVFGHIARN